MGENIDCCGKQSKLYLHRQMYIYSHIQNLDLNVCDMKLEKGGWAGSKEFNVMLKDEPERSF